MRTTCASGRPGRRAARLGGLNRGWRPVAQPRPRPAPPPGSRLGIATRDSATDRAFRNPADRGVGSAVRIRFVLLALLALAVGACAVPQGHAGHAAAATTSTAAVRTGQARFPPRGILPPARRRPAPALQVTAFDGRTVTLEGMRGRPVLVSFFESWCPNCQEEQPDLTRVAAEFAGRVGFIGVSYNDTVAGGRAYQRRLHVPSPPAND